LLRIYRRGRKAARAAVKDPSTENLHELRKRAKDLWYAARILRPVAPKRMRALGRDAHRLSDLIGEDHDLSVLEQHATRHRSQLANDAAFTALEGLSARRRRQLQSQALRRARRRYRTKPTKLARRWRAASPERRRS
jgi:CHAD domain-containing protein